MRLSYRLKRVCGNVHSNGNIIFTPDGNTLISAVGNRISTFDLVHHSTATMSFENRKNIQRIAISNNGRFLISIDVDGHALIVNFPRMVVLQRLHFKKAVFDIQFSPDDNYFAITFGNGCQIWQTPCIQREFAPLRLCRNLTGFHDQTSSLDWSADSLSIIIGSRDLSSRIYYRVTSKNMAMTVLSGHRGVVVGTFFAASGDEAYTIGCDGAVFTWKFQIGERKIISSLPRNNEDSDSDSESDSVGDHGHAVQPLTQRGSSWTLSSREFLWDPHVEVTSCAFNKKNSLLVIGFNKGVFGLYSMPGCVNIHRLSVSHCSLSTASINTSGEWLALGSAKLGQLLVWEWQSETYVLKQQGHLYGLKTLDYSADGQFIATGGEDGKVKLWNVASGFCFVTFSEHTAPVTGVRFTGAGQGRAVLSCALDGTVRAHDLQRYRCFKTLTTATAAQLTCVAADHSGEVVCAGALDPFNIFVWSLQTGQLIDVLAGHEGPISCLEFSPNVALLASGSWDGTLKLWDIFKNANTETMEHGCDVLSVSFRHDGREVATCATNGNIYVWDVESAAQLSIIEGRRDLTGGRLTSDARTADNSAKSKHFSAVTYSADGSCVLAAGRSKYCCLYSAVTGVLVKKFQLSHNRSLEGVLDELRSDSRVDGVSLSELPQSAAKDAQQLQGQGRTSALTDGSRSTRPELVTSALRFCPTGREWAAASTQGLQIFSLDEAMLFAPTDLDIALTPQAVAAALSRQQYSLAVNMALHLGRGEGRVLKNAVDSVPVAATELVVQSLDLRMLGDLMSFIAEELLASRHVEVYLRWLWSIIHAHGSYLQREGASHMQALRALVRAVSSHDKEVLQACDHNHFTLSFLQSQLSIDSPEQFESAPENVDNCTDILDRKRKMK